MRGGETMVVVVGVEVVVVVVVVEAACHVAGWWWSPARVCQIIDDATACQRGEGVGGEGGKRSSR